MLKVSNFLLLDVTFIASYTYPKEHGLNKLDILPLPTKTSLQNWGKAIPLLGDNGKISRNTDLIKDTLQ